MLRLLKFARMNSSSAVLRRAVTSDPAGRYQSAREFREALRKARGFARRLVTFLRGE